MGSETHAGTPEPGDDASDAPAPAHRPAHAPAHASAHASRGRPNLWRWLGTPLVVGIAVLILATSWRESDGTDLRSQRYDGLVGLVEDDSREVQDKNARVADLTADVQTLTDAVADREVQRLQRQQEKLRGPAGLTELTGPAVTVTLSDAPYDLDDPPDVEEIKPLVVHQQDIQAVVNAMWAGGAEGITVQGQRIVSTTGIKCEGNSVTLQGVPYPAPYVITAVGPQEEILGALESSSYLAAYRAQAANPDIGIGWSLETNSQLTIPAYSGLLDITYARVDR